MCCIEGLSLGEVSLLGSGIWGLQVGEKLSVFGGLVVS